MEETLVAIASDIVAAYVANNSVALADLPSLIGDVHRALVDVANPVAETPAEAQKPAVSIKKSVSPDFLICLEDGKKFKSLKRHLRTQYNMSPDEYRAKWGLPADYPMVAPSYAEQRSKLAKNLGLGTLRKKPAPEPVAAPAKTVRAKRVARK